MKTYTKILIGLSLLVGLLAFGLFTQKAFADRTCIFAACSKSDVTNATYKFLDKTTIEGVFRGGKTVRFQQVFEIGKKFPIFEAERGAFCGGGGINNSNRGSITFSEDELKKIGGGAKILYGDVDIDYDDITQVANPTCIDFEVGGQAVTNLDGAAGDSYTWDDDTLVSYGKGITLTDFGDGLYYQEKTGCSGWVVVLDSKGGNSGKEYELGGNPFEGDEDANIYLPKYFKVTGQCWIKTGPTDVTITGNFNEPAPGGGGSPGNNFRGSATPSCESNFSWGFEWFLCPALDQMDNAAGSLNSFVQRQLCINTGSTSDTAGAVKCGGNEILTEQTKDAWSGFRVIATSLLVIVMLIAIISQSTGIGPVDAYALRKMLPKIVAAVILIQISWYLAKFAVDLSNDLGKGVQSLLYAPFGGEQNMKLDDLIGTKIGTATGGDGDVFALFAVLAAAVAIAVSLPGLILLGFYVVLALFVAFFVLLLRKIFVLLLVIILPLALIAWIIPGTEKYWKNWSNNFTRLLLMFPLIMALIAGGRIFAYLATDPLGVIFRPQLATYDLGPLSVPYFAAAGDFATLAIIILAFFAPYFLLPMTFKWGGSLMGMVADAIDRRRMKAQERGKEAISGFMDRNYRGPLAAGYSPDAKFMSRVGRRLASGHILPTKRSQRLAIAAGDKWRTEREEEALALINRKGEKAREGYKTFLRNDDGELIKLSRDAEGNMLDAKGNITTDEKDAHQIKTNEAEAEVRTFKGVQAMKQMWVDLSEEGRDHHEQKMAIRQLNATSSWPEVQGSFTKSGKRVIDTDIWSDAVIGSPEDYSKVLRSRVDATPHIDDAADEALSAEKEKRASKKARALTGVEERNFKSAFRIKYALEKQMSNEDFATQSDGFWVEAARMSQHIDPDTGLLSETAQLIRSTLKARFKAIQDSGGNNPQIMLGHLANGGKLQTAVDTILGDEKVTDYMSGRGKGPPPPPTQPPSPGTTLQPDEGTMDIPHDK